MSDTVTLQVSATAVQTVTVTAAVVVNGVTQDNPSLAWTSGDESIATIAPTPGVAQQARVTAVRDPSGPSTRATPITATATVGSVTYTGSGVATVTTLADSVTVTLEFGSPEFVTP